jgi:hypothetical protein
MLLKVRKMVPPMLEKFHKGALPNANDPAIATVIPTNTPQAKWGE